jgi:hypothetical protein
MSRYPLVDCDTHGPDLQGFAVCVHVLQQHRAIAHVVLPTRDHLGEMLCTSCHVALATTDDLRLICARCAENLIP